MKRGFDLFCTLLSLPLWLPMLLLLAVVVRLAMGKPVFFIQRRLGERGVPFAMVKFRTMTTTRDTKGNLLPDEQRLTLIGRWLRSTSLDELPQVLNVLRGEMSLVGPRPLLVHYLERYSARQARRHELKPGITGWAQVQGRNAISWEEKFELDVWYVENCSFRLDLKILFLTFARVFQRHGISAPTSPTAPEFMGSK